LTEYAANISAGLNIPASLDALTVTGQAANINVGLNFTTGRDILTLTEYAAAVQVNADTEINATCDALLLAALNATISTTGINILAGVDSLILSSAGENIVTCIPKGGYPLAGIDVSYPLAGVDTQYPLAGQSVQYPLAGVDVQYPLAGIERTYP
jgi:hypothetical protein